MLTDVATIHIHCMQFSNEYLSIRWKKLVPVNLLLLCNLFVNTLSLHCLKVCVSKGVDCKITWQQTSSHKITYPPSHIHTQIYVHTYIGIPPTSHMSDLPPTCLIYLLHIPHNSHKSHQPPTSPTYISQVPPTCHKSHLPATSPTYVPQFPPTSHKSHLHFRSPTYLPQIPLTSHKSHLPPKCLV